ncbi:alpha/beta hydrolase [Deinococcus radiopugnans]|uniref:alpha/beta hydrolase n=1 Tax=Deinococcus radiopugnans TaxID=57497 RepID=UPI00361C48DA
MGADETLTALAAEGLEAIAVGIPNGNERRYHEYSPVRHPGFPPEVEGGGGGDAYLVFLTDTVKPLVDGHLRTLPDAAHTSLIGSSMGGLISLHALLTRPDVFGGAGVMSPAFWACAGEAFDRVRRSSPMGGKVWLDIGGREGTDHPERQQAYWDDAHAMRDLLQQGLGERLRFQADPEGIHRETAWKVRLPEALRFLLDEQV